MVEEGEQDHAQSPRRPDHCREGTNSRGSGSEKFIFFQMPPKSFLSVRIYPIRCEYDILKVLLKKLTRTYLLGVSNMQTRDLGWFSCWIFVDF